MENQNLAKELIKARDGNKNHKFPLNILIVFIIGLLLLSQHEKSDTLPWGMMLLGISIGAFVVEMKWRTNGRASFEQMKPYFNWAKVEEDAKVQNSNKGE